MIFITEPTDPILKIRIVYSVHELRYAAAKYWQLKPPSKSFYIYPDAD